MKDIFTKLILALYSISIRAHIKQVIKVRTTIRSVIFFRLCLSACILFPDNRLSQNANMATTVCNLLLHLDKNEDSADVEREALYTKAQANECIKGSIANYFLVEAYLYSSLSICAQKAKLAMDYAQQSVDSATPLSKSEILELYKKVKKEKKSLLKETRKVTDNRIMEDKLKLFNPIKITATHFYVALSLLSTMFLVSGFLYIKSFFYWFNVDVGDFYSIQDYLSSSSIDVISERAFSTLGGLIVFLFIFNLRLKDELIERQINNKIEEQNINWPFYLSVLISINLVAHTAMFTVSIYKAGLWDSAFIFSLMPMLLVIIGFILSLKYIKNRGTFVVVCLVVSTFFISLGSKIEEDVESVIYGTYESKYNLELTDDYSEYQNFSYLTGNSNYIFLLDKEKIEIIILPKSSIKLLKVKPNKMVASDS